jgi:hypothetical protein
MLINVRDEITGQTGTCDTADFAELVTPWYTDPTPEVTTMVTECQTALNRGEYTGDLETGLALRITHAA